MRGWAWLNPLPDPLVPRLRLLLLSNIANKRTYLK